MEDFKKILFDEAGYLIFRAANGGTMQLADFTKQKGLIISYLQSYQSILEVVCRNYTPNEKKCSELVQKVTSTTKNIDTLPSNEFNKTTEDILDSIAKITDELSEDYRQQKSGIKSLQTYLEGLRASRV